MNIRGVTTLEDNLALVIHNAYPCRLGTHNLQEIAQCNVSLQAGGRVDLQRYAGPPPPAGVAGLVAAAEGRGRSALVVGHAGRADHAGAHRHADRPLQQHYHEAADRQSPPLRPVARLLRPGVVGGGLVPAGANGRVSCGWCTSRTC